MDNSVKGSKTMKAKTSLILIQIFVQSQIHNTLITPIVLSLTVINLKNHSFFQTISKSNHNPT